MKATVTKVDPLRESHNKAQSFYRLYFKLEDESWAATDVVPSFRNFKKWSRIIALGAGTELGGIKLKGKGKVNADCPVFIISEPKIEKENSEVG